MDEEVEQLWEEPEELWEEFAPAPAAAADEGAWPGGQLWAEFVDEKPL